MQRNKRIAVFLDRDGTINKEVGYLHRKKDLRLLPHAADAIRQLNRLGVIIIVIANQAAVAKGLITEKGIDDLNTMVNKRLSKKGAQVDGFYFCPHHPNATLAKYRKNCQDRKPNTGLIKKAIKDFNLSLRGAFFVGDTTTDVLTAKNLGIRSILVKTGYGGKDGKFDVNSDYKVKDLADAVIYIKKRLKK